jgi:hypothetical protein
VVYTYGADFKLDVGHYRLDQQVACQRYRQTLIDANTSFSNAKAAVAALFERSGLNMSSVALAA